MDLPLEYHAILAEAELLSDTDKKLLGYILEEERFSAEEAAALFGVPPEDVCMLFAWAIDRGLIEGIMVMVDEDGNREEVHIQGLHQVSTEDVEDWDEYFPEN